LRLRQRLLRPRPAAGPGGRQVDRRTGRPRRLAHDRLLGVRLRAHRRRPALPRTQRDLTVSTSQSSAPSIASAMEPIIAATKPVRPWVPIAASPAPVALTTD